MRQHTVDANRKAAGVRAVADLLAPEALRAVLGRFATGVVAVTGLDADSRPVGLAVNSFTSVSLQPPLVGFCVAHTSRSWPVLRRAGRHCLNILGDDQREVCARLAGRGEAKFAGLDWAPSPSGAPVLPGALAWLECAVETEYTAGDHVIVVARVCHADRSAEGEPLVFFGGRYGTFGAAADD